MMFINFQSTIVQHFLLVIIIKVLNLLTLFILMCEGQLVTLYRGLSDLYPLLMIVPILRLDNGTKFVNLEFSKFLKDNGVVHELTESYPNCFISHQQLSLPNCVFRCISFIHSHNPHCGKLDSRAIKCVFIGYPSNKNEFKCYHPPSCRSFFVSPSLQVESYLEVESIIKSLPFPTQDVIKSLPFPTQDVQVQEVTKPILVQRKSNCLSRRQVFKNPIEDVTDDMPIALRKWK
ncbi:hypothetical protein CR513_19131, partial [Mucuna pruriens]